MVRETITISSVASPEPRIVTLDSDSNDPTIPYGFGSQHPVERPSLKDLNLPPNPFNALATMAVIRADQAYSPQSPDPSIPSPISTPSMSVSTSKVWQRTQQLMMPHFTLMMSPDESTGIFCQATLLTPMSQEMCLSLRALPPLRRLHEDKKKKLSTGMSFPKNGGVSQHTCEACGQPLRARKHSDSQEKLKLYILSTRLQTITISSILTVVHIYGYVYKTYP